MREGSKWLIISDVFMRWDKAALPYCSTGELRCRMIQKEGSTIGTAAWDLEDLRSIPRSSRLPLPPPAWHTEHLRSGYTEQALSS